MRRRRFGLGVISDTHGLLRPEAVETLRGSDMIVHAGDVGSPDVLRELQTLAPIIAVRGNNDHGPWAEALPLTDSFELGRASIYVIHDVNELHIDPRASGHAVVIAGHSHRPLAEVRDGVLFFNPGSAGPRRFRLPVSVGHIVIEGSRVTGRLETLRDHDVKVLIAKPGLDGHDRGAKVVAQALRDAGFEVVYTGLKRTPEEIIAEAIQEDADVVGLSILSGAHLLLARRVIEGLRAAGAHDIDVIVGGTIPPRDVEPLKALGTAAVLPMGSPLPEIVAAFKRPHRELRSPHPDPTGEPPS